MDEFEVRRLPTAPLVVYVVSTTGQGEEPDNMKKTWRSAELIETCDDLMARVLLGFCSARIFLRTLCRPRGSESWASGTRATPSLTTLPRSCTSGCLSWAGCSCWPRGWATTSTTSARTLSSTRGCSPSGASPCSSTPCPPASSPSARRFCPAPSTGSGGWMTWTMVWTQRTPSPASTPCAR